MDPRLYHINLPAAPRSPPPPAQIVWIQSPDGTKTPLRDSNGNYVDAATYRGPTEVTITRPAAAAVHPDMYLFDAGNGNVVPVQVRNGQVVPRTAEVREQLPVLLEGRTYYVWRDGSLRTVRETR